VNHQQHSEYIDRIKATQEEIYVPDSLELTDEEADVLETLDEDMHIFFRGLMARRALPVSTEYDFLPQALDKAVAVFLLNAKIYDKAFEEGRRAWKNSQNTSTD
jgi:hypothetical protein